MLAGDPVTRALLGWWLGLAFVARQEANAGILRLRLRMTTPAVGWWLGLAFVARDKKTNAGILRLRLRMTTLKGQRQNDNFEGSAAE